MALIGQSLAFVYVNAEGKANSEFQLRVILESVRKRHGTSWILIGISEADYRSSDDTETMWLGNHFVQRIPIAGGRAAKIVWNAGCEEFSRGVVRAGRSFRVDLDFCRAVAQSVKPYAKSSLVIAHLAHGDEWTDSFDDLNYLLTFAPRGNQKFVIGDLNVEGRESKQDDDAYEKWALLTASMDAANLVAGLPMDDSLVTRRPRGLSALMSDPSYIDHCFIPVASHASGAIVWDEVIGDHAWIDVVLNIADRRVRRKPTTWKCRDLHAYREDVLSSLPAFFESAGHFEKFFSGKVEEHRSPLSARQRRKIWEPFSIKVLRAQIKNSTDESERVSLSQRLFKERVAWAKNRDVLAAAQEVKAKTRKSVKRQRLFPLTEIEIDGVLQTDPASWASDAESDFESRWRQEVLSDLAMFEDLDGSMPASVVVYDSDVWRAIDALKKPWVLDHAGVCGAALRLVPEVAEPLAILASLLLSSDSEWDEISVQGFVKGKERGQIPMSKTRGLLPQTVLLNVLNRIVMAKIGPRLDAASEHLGVKNLILGGAKGSQPQDITFTVAQVLEKGRDRHDAAAVAQSDIEKFHDTVPWGFTLKALLSRQVPEEWARAALRVHRCPRVQLRVGSEMTRNLERSRSVLTGSPSAGMLARLCVEDTYMAALTEMESSSFEVHESYRLAAMSWSDNLFTFADTAERACTMMMVWAHYLWCMCGLRLKAGSYEVIRSSTRLYEQRDLQIRGATWKLISTMFSLGHCLTSTGSQSTERKRLKQSWEAAFWRNSRVLTCKCIDRTSRLKFWRTISQGIGSFRYSMWAPNKAAAKLVEGWHAKILQRIIRVQLEEGETPDRFCRRRNHIVAEERDRLGLAVRREWALSLVRWVEHLRRHLALPACVLLSVQDDLWLQICRGVAGSSNRDATLQAGATRTRTGAGKPIRWGETWIESLRSEHGVDNEARSKRMTKKRAEFVNSNFLHD